MAGGDSGSDIHGGIVGAARDSGSDFHSGIVGVGGIVQWRIVGKDGIIVEVMEVVGVEGSRVLVERYLPLHDTVLKRYRVANLRLYSNHLRTSDTGQVADNPNRSAAQASFSRHIYGVDKRQEPSNDGCRPCDGSAAASTRRAHAQRARQA